MKVLLIIFQRVRKFVDDYKTHKNVFAIGFTLLIIIIIVMKSKNLFYPYRFQNQWGWNILIKILYHSNSHHVYGTRDIILFFFNVSLINILRLVDGRFLQALMSTIVWHKYRRTCLEYIITNLIWQIFATRAMAIITCNIRPIFTRLQKTN